MVFGRSRLVIVEQQGLILAGLDLAGIGCGAPQDGLWHDGRGVTRVRDRWSGRAQVAFGRRVYRRLRCTDSVVKILVVVVR
jgi:hypothetical protein